MHSPEQKSGNTKYLWEGKEIETNLIDGSTKCYNHFKEQLEIVGDTEDELLSYQATPFQVVGLEKLLYVVPKDPDPALPHS